MKPGQHVLMAGALLGALLTADAARAQGSAGETWSCAATTAVDQAPQPRVFSLHKDLLIEQSPGVARYHLLANTVHGLVAVDHSTDLELGYVDLFVSTMLIDKVTGGFIATASITGSVPQQQTGHCRKLAAEATMGGVVAGRK